MWITHNPISGVYVNPVAWITFFCCSSQQVLAIASMKLAMAPIPQRVRDKIKEGWQSGRMHQSYELESPQKDRGFESRTLRTYPTSCLVPESPYQYSILFSVSHRRGGGGLVLLCAVLGRAAVHASPPSMTHSYRTQRTGVYRGHRMFFLLHCISPSLS